MAHQRLGTAVLGGLLAVLAVSASPGMRAQGARPAGWTEASHGAKGAPDYRRLFAMDRVHELRIAIPKDEFQKMQADLATIGPPGMPFGPGGPGGRGPAGAPGAGPGGPGGPGRGGFGRGGPDPQQMQAMMEEGIKACTNKPADASCSASGMDGKCTAMFGGPMMACVPEAMAKMMAGGAMRLTTRDPIYVPVTVTYADKTWTKVAMRYKGNSSLVTASGTGNGKVPFRLDVNRFAKADPTIAGQRLYGFEELTFSSNFADDSQLREVLGNEIFRDRGVPAPRAAFYRVFVDVGSGPEYWGLYTMVEDPSDGAMLDSQLAGRSSNLYKPDGPGADWTKFDREGFGKKTNESEADYKDVEAALAALHAPQDNPAQWRARLESTFDVDMFLRWLAVNTAIQNWDTYGAMAHNYYLYGDPKKNGRLQWIPWDNNMSFGVGPGGPAAPGGPGLPPPGARGRGAAPPGGPGADNPPPFMAAMMGSQDVLHRKVGSRWPLIEKVMADPVYAARYRKLLAESLGGAYELNTFAKRARQLYALVAPYVVGPQGERDTHTTISSVEAFKQSVDGPGGLVEVVRKRHAEIRAALEGK
ncbi:MAG TPA: CotH kinase family protein [Vicinamibacterales bacterium]